MKKSALQINGRKMTFSEEELTAILEKHFGEETAETAKAEALAETTKPKTTKFEVAQVPTEGKCFEVNPMGIDRSLFQKKRSDRQQEWTRQIILEAFTEVDKHPEKYAKPFKTLIPEKTWDGYKTGKELKQYAEYIGDHIANWVEQVLEWAQRIANGETWKAVCNDQETTDWYRAVVWKDGNLRLVGFSSVSETNCPNIEDDGNYSSCEIGNIICHDNAWIFYTVPLVVLY